MSDKIEKMIESLGEQINKRFDAIEKNMISHENITVQLISMVADVKRETETIKQDIEFICKDNAITRLEVERIRRNKDL